ncbi:MAG: hypothetical protein JST00_30105 [Deltaproteobacteria bacterium]|nr:hypothetical protein [Deltaproteobacteria bacterium]
MRSLTMSVVLVVSLAALGCGGGEEGPPVKSPSAPGPMPPPPTTTAAAVPEKITSLKRSEVKLTIQRGLGYFLQNVSVDDWPVMREGKFHGFRIRSINETWGLDLRAGDVVTRVNGMPIEHPDEADAAMRALEKAKALRVDFEREGKPRTLELPITED